jgi:hypothetical protein
MGFDYLDIPAWALAIMYFVSLLLARECGHWLRKRRPERTSEDESFATTSVLGLLALLIGFTFSVALQRYETRRELVVQEANALGTTWLRTDLLEGDQQAAVRTTLLRYVDARVAYGLAGSRAAEADAYAAAARLQSQLWSQVVAATASFRDTPRAASVISTTNESIDLAGERYANRESHVPPRILRTLWFFSIVAAAWWASSGGRCAMRPRCCSSFSRWRWRWSSTWIDQQRASRESRRSR